jgi:hypothetical protein
MLHPHVSGQRIVPREGLLLGAKVANICGLVESTLHSFQKY